MKFKVIEEKAQYENEVLYKKYRVYRKFLWWWKEVGEGFKSLTEAQTTIRSYQADYKTKKAIVTLTEVDWDNSDKINNSKIMAKRKQKGK